jgi:hypothetical protein
MRWRLMWGISSASSSQGWEFWLSNLESGQGKAHYCRPAVLAKRRIWFGGGAKAGLDWSGKLQEESRDRGLFKVWQLSMACRTVFALL